LARIPGRPLTDYEVRTTRLEAVRDTSKPATS
jgi:hypothetical protein